MDSPCLPRENMWHGQLHSPLSTHNYDDGDGWNYTPEAFSLISVVTVFLIPYLPDGKIQILM